MLTCCNMAPTLGAMGHYDPRAAADELYAEARAARAAAERELVNMGAHLEAMKAASSPEEWEALSFQARRSKRIADAEFENASAKSAEAARLSAQVTVVS